MIGDFLLAFLKKISVNYFASCDIRPNSFRFRLSGSVPLSCVVSAFIGWCWRGEWVEIGTLAKVVSWGLNTDRARWIRKCSHFTCGASCSRRNAFSSFCATLPVFLQFLV